MESGITETVEYDRNLNQQEETGRKLCSENFCSFMWKVPSCHGNISQHCTSNAMSLAN